MNTNSRLKSIAKLIGFVVIIALLAYWIYTYLHTGKLVVTTDQNNMVTVNKLDGTKITQHVGGVSVKLGDGQYGVSVHGKVLSTNQIVTIKGRQVVTKSIHTKRAFIIQPVVNMPVQNVRATGGSLSFLNSTEGRVYRIDESNTLTSLSGSGSYRLASWLDNNTAILQSQAGYLFLLANGQITPLETNIPALRGAVSTFGIAPNKAIYVAVGRAVYVGDSSGEYRKIYDAKSIVSALYPSDNSVAVLTTKIGGSKHPETTATVSLITKYGQFIAANSFPLNDEFEAGFSVAWSPNGQQLAIANDTSVGAIFDKSLKKITDLPSPDVTSIAWRNNSQLYYATTNLLWLYQTGNRSSSVVANAAVGNSISNITVDDTTAYVYFTVASDQNINLGRISLGGQVLSDSAYQLAAFFPIDLNNCEVDFINFVHPVLLVTYDGDLASCQSQLFKALEQDGLSLEGISVQYIPTP